MTSLELRTTPTCPHPPPLCATYRGTNIMAARISLRRLGDAVGKKAALPGTMEELLTLATKKLELGAPALRIFSESGDEYESDDIGLIGTNEVLYVSCGEAFYPPAAMTTAPSPPPPTPPLPTTTTMTPEQAPTDTRRTFLLVVVCSPSSAPLSSAIQEANAVRDRLSSTHRYEQRTGCSASELRDVLSELNPMFVLFIGHADARHRLTCELTLGLTDSSGEVVRMLPETTAGIVGESDAWLVMFNGCESQELAEKVYAVGGQITVCWSTKLLDSAAAIFSPAFFGHLSDKLARRDYERINRDELLLN